MIHLLNSVPEMPYASEIVGMEPIILSGDLARIERRQRSKSKGKLS